MCILVVNLSHDFYDYLGSRVVLSLFRSENGSHLIVHNIRILIIDFIKDEIYILIFDSNSKFEY